MPAGSMRLLGGDFDGRIEIHLSPRTLWSHCAMARSRDLYAVLPHSSQMKSDGLLDPPERGIDRLPRHHACRQIRDRRSPVTSLVFVDAYEISDRLHLNSFKLAT
jgi:hypothetical protein